MPRCNGTPFYWYLAIPSARMRIPLPENPSPSSAKDSSGVTWVSRQSIRETTNVRYLIKARSY